MSNHVPWRRPAGVLFAIFLLLVLTTPGWRSGPFTWLPLWSAPMLAGRPATIGLLGALPLVISALWLWQRRGAARGWEWGAASVSGPLLILSFLVLGSLDLTLSWRTLTLAGSITLVWFVYLFLLNERQSLTFPLAVAVIVQAIVALAQFWLQRDVGLAAWGELPLDPLVEGITVLQARGQPWLRAPGLTAHPNVLGAMLTVLLLWLLPHWRRAPARRRSLLALTFALGLAGLVVTFSRAAWLGFGIGLAVAFWNWRASPLGLRPRPIWLVPALFLLPAMLLLWLNADLVASRFLALETPIEARSLRERMEEVRVIAPAIIAQRPLTGVGAGNYLAAAEVVQGTAVVAHNVTLLVMAELGLIGAAAWLWLAVAGARLGWRSQRASAWVAMLVISLFDNSLWLTASWRGAILFGLLLASVVADRDASKKYVTSWLHIS